MTLKLSAKSLTLAKWFVDAAYAVRDDYKSQFGAMMTMGTGAMLGKSTKQKGNSKSSTQAELMAAGDASSQIIWTKNFMEAQGYTTSTAILYQDNKSAILLEKSGRMSCGKNTKHINIRYFFITDYIKKGYINVEYCPTRKMVADFFTKPLQGALFTMFRDMIMGIIPMDEVDYSKAPQ